MCFCFSEKSKTPALFADGVAPENGFSSTDCEDDPIPLPLVDYRRCKWIIKKVDEEKKKAAELESSRGPSGKIVKVCVFVYGILIRCTLICVSEA